MASYSSLFKNISLNFKFLFRNYGTIIKLLSMSASFVLLVVFLFPFYYGASFVFECSIISSTSVIFFLINCEWKKSTLNKNLLLTSTKKIYYLSSFIVIFIVAFIMANLILLVFYLLSISNLLISAWFFKKTMMHIQVILIIFIFFHYTIHLFEW